MSDAIEFGFDDSKSIKTSDVDLFKQSRSGEKTRVSIISFKRFHDGVIAKKAKEKGSPLSDAEKAEILGKVDAKLAEQLKKDPKDMTEADRLDIKNPRFSYAFTHFGEGVGTIRCLSKYHGTTVQQAEICCDKFGDATQTVGVVVMTYPVDDKLQVDEELLRQRKYTNFFVWKMSAQKFKKLETAYVEARNDNRFTIDLSVKLDGDPKYQKQEITALGGAAWARENTDPATRGWVLDQGLRLWKHVEKNLGFAMKKETLLEKLGQSKPQLSGESATPALVSGYDELLT